MADYDPRMLARALSGQPAMNFEAAEDAQRQRSYDMLRSRGAQGRPHENMVVPEAPPPGHADSPFRLQDEMDPSQRPVFHGLGTDRMIIDPDDVGNPLRGAAPYRPTPQIREYQPNMPKRWWENV